MHLARLPQLQVADNAQQWLDQDVRASDARGSCFAGSRDRGSDRDQIAVLETVKVRLGDFRLVLTETLVVNFDDWLRNVAKEPVAFAGVVSPYAPRVREVTDEPRILAKETRAVCVGRTDRIECDVCSVPSRHALEWLPDEVVDHGGGANTVFDE